VLSPIKEIVRFSAFVGVITNHRSRNILLPLLVLSPIKEIVRFAAFVGVITNHRSRNILMDIMKESRI
jgi:hypothetical protein